MSATAAAVLPDRATLARRGLSIYFTVLIIGSATFEWLILRTGEQIGSHIGLIFALMWTPAFASLVARVALREGIRDVSFRLGGARGGKALLAAWLMPLVVATIAYGIAWAAGLAQFNPPAAKIGPALASPAARFAVALGLALTLSAVIGCTSAMGEEIGWRGYMLTRLIDAGVPQPLLVSGVIWGSWHLPLILSGQYASSAHPALSAGIFLVDVIGIAIVIGSLRLWSGSIWPAVLLHGTWNAVIQGPFDRSAQGPNAELWIGESGVLVALVSIGVAIYFARNWRGVRRWPDDPDGES